MQEAQLVWDTTASIVATEMLLPQGRCPQYKHHKRLFNTSFL